MQKRVFLAGLLGGAAMFGWSSVAHLALPLAKVGIQEIPNEPATLRALQTSLGQSSGLYLYPALGSDSAAEYARKVASNPSGLLIYHPAGAATLSMGQLATESAAYMSIQIGGFLCAGLVAAAILKPPAAA
jgi:hypothetical protein